MCAPGTVLFPLTNPLYLHCPTGFVIGLCLLLMLQIMITLKRALVVKERLAVRFASFPIGMYEGVCFVYTICNTSDWFCHGTLPPVAHDDLAENVRQLWKRQQAAIFAWRRILLAWLFSPLAVAYSRFLHFKAFGGTIQCSSWLRDIFFSFSATRSP